jgi:hypothetical protein
MKWEYHVARMGAKSITYRVLIGNLKDKDHYDVQFIHGRVILKLVLNQQDGRLVAGFTWLRMRTGGGLLRTR